MSYNPLSIEKQQVIEQRTDYGHTMAKSLILCGQNSNPNKYLGFGYNGLVFCRNNGSLMENMDKGLIVHTKMSADKSFENTPNAPKFISPNCLPKSKSSGFLY